MNKAAKIALVTIGVRAAGLIGLSTLSNSASNQPAPEVFSKEYENRDYDCGYFDTHSEAQDFFEAEGSGDPHRLGGDGVACETLP